MLKKAFSVGAIAFLFAGLSAAQEVGHFDASIAWGGAFSHTSSSSIGNVSVESTNSGLLLGSFRFRFTHTHGIIANVGRTIDSQIFVIPPDNYRVQTTIMEYSGAYMFSPFHFAKIDPFVFGGGGALRFSPGATFIDGVESKFGTARQSALAILYGGGFNYPVWKRFGIRAQYRGLIYKQPTLGEQQFFTGATAYASEATIGVVYNF